MHVNRDLSQIEVCVLFVRNLHEMERIMPTNSRDCCMDCRSSWEYEYPYPPLGMTLHMRYALFVGTEFM